MTLYKTCRQKLARMHLESVKTFNILSLVAAYPKNQEQRTALQLQREREEQAQFEYQKCAHNLFEQIHRQP